MTSRTLVMGDLREQGTVVLVAGLAGFYASSLLMASGFLTTIADQGDGTLGILLTATSSVFIAIALYVAAVVMSGCVSTVIAGRVKQIALLRLLGSDATSLRGSVAHSCAVAGLAGAVGGAVLGTLPADAALAVLVRRDIFPGELHEYPLVQPMAFLSVLPVVATAWVAGRLGSRSVLTISPSQAMSTADTATEDRRAGRVRTALAVLLLGVGTLTMALAARMGENTSEAAFFIAFLGCALTATGVLVGANLVVPPLVRIFGAVLGGNPAGRIARRNAVADRRRTTRSTLGLVVGVTLVTTFASGFAALKQSTQDWDLTAQQREAVERTLTMTSTVMICIVVVSCVMAAVGFVSTMSLTVLKRRREIGMLRALGFTRSQVRSMITRESVALGLTAVLFGVFLGVVFGSVGAQSLIGFMNDGFKIGLPFPVLAVIVAAATVLVLVAALPPARRAIRVAPVDALRIEA